MTTKAKRHCSVCNLPGHDARAHHKRPVKTRRNPAPRAFKRWVKKGEPGFKGKRPTRRNLDAYTDAGGVIHPIRGSDGYSGTIEASGQAGRKRQETADYYREMASYADEWEEDAGKYWRDQVRDAVKNVSRFGIAPHEKTRGGSSLRTEYRLQVPLYLRNNRGLPADEVAHLIKYQFPELGIETEDDLLQALAA